MNAAVARLFGIESPVPANTPAIPMTKIKCVLCGKKFDARDHEQMDTSISEYLVTCETCTHDERPTMEVAGSAELLTNTGLMFEINRTVLHQFGLALVPTYGPGGEMLNLTVIRDRDSAGALYDLGAFIEG